MVTITPGEAPGNITVKNIGYDPKERPRSSITLGKLAAALAKAQGEMSNAEKDVKGNFGKYATLASTWESIRQPLSKNEIAIYQRPLTIDGKLFMATMLIHSSGEFLDDGELELKFDTNGRISAMQALGSAVTYARRYTLQAATGIAPADDDDGSAAGTPQEPPRPAQPQAAAKPPPRNHAPKPTPKPTDPASQDMINQIYSFCAERQINESILLALIKEYGYPMNKVPVFVANEVVKLLEIEDCKDTTLLAHAEKVRKRREEAQQGGPK